MANGRKRLPSTKRPRARTRGVFLWGILWALLLLAALYFWLLVSLVHHDAPKVPDPAAPAAAVRDDPPVEDPPHAPEAATTTTETCPFRDYPPHRYYHKDQQPLPEFLADAEYIYGESPVLLETAGSRKLCVDQSEWHDGGDGRLPFADGTNPSIVRLGPHLASLGAAPFPPGAAFLATVCMTDSQCSWRETPEEAALYKVSTRQKASTVRTVLLVLDERFGVLEETTIFTNIDAPFGRRIKPRKQPPFEQRAFALDDARLFVHAGALWVSYREGRHFGFDKQVLHPLHLDRNGEGRLGATLLASEVETLCCGRNMALLDEAATGRLHAVTWVDPLTVEEVVLQHSPNPPATNADPPNNQNQKKKHKNKKSDFHGTNGAMVHLPATGEYLGVGHFHRPPGRDENDYARFGHHYTHAFYTVPDRPPYRLQRLSPELLLPSSSGDPTDAEIIQFWSGLEWTAGEEKEGTTLALAYGINDCEAAAVTVGLSTIEALLREVPPGTEVVDLLRRPAA